MNTEFITKLILELTTPPSSGFVPKIIDGSFKQKKKTGGLKSESIFKVTEAISLFHEDPQRLPLLIWFWDFRSANLPEFPPSPLNVTTLISGEHQVLVIALSHLAFNSRVAHMFCIGERTVFYLCSRVKWGISFAGVRGSSASWYHWCYLKMRLGAGHLLHVSSGNLWRIALIYKSLDTASTYCNNVTPRWHPPWLCNIHKIPQFSPRIRHLGDFQLVDIQRVDECFHLAGICALVPKLTLPRLDNGIGLLDTVLRVC